MEVKTQWMKCGKEPESKWCNLLTVNLEHDHFNDLEGIYIIWHGRKEAVKAATVRVGQGIIRDRLTEHKSNEEILKYKPYELYVTWAKIDKVYLDGVERYLAEVLKPIVGSRFPDVQPIEINWPW
ncbi:MAG: hypothetical protein U9R38_08190 [Candidatus Margulisiibacteriota bacterium]|nr:hypothetical protein [Candidatus Margulisiibacteriota bacterium]